MPVSASEMISRFGSVNTVLWVATLLSFLLLVMVGTVSEVFSSRRRDVVMLFLRSAVFFLVPLLAVVPAMVVTVNARGGLSYALVVYMVLFACFCYYLGKRVGVAKGKRDISELVGLDSPDSIEDAQDRLFESRMRLVSRSSVMDSIAEMAKVREAARLEEERNGGGRPPASVAEVAVEAILRDKNNNLRP